MADHVRNQTNSKEEDNASYEPAIDFELDGELAEDEEPIFEERGKRSSVDVRRKIEEKLELKRLREELGIDDLDDLDLLG